MIDRRQLFRHQGGRWQDARLSRRATLF